MNDTIIGWLLFNWGFWFPAFMASLALLLIFLKGRRLSFVLPLALIAAAICNKEFLFLWNRVGLYAYWRVLWLIPVVPACAAVPGAITEKLSGTFSKLAVTAFCIVAFMFGGTFLYAYANDNEIGSSWGSTFAVPAANAEKIPQTAKEAAEWLLTQNEHPRIVAEPDLSMYLRQYSAEIKQLYGRDIAGFIYSDAVSNDARAVHKALTDPEGDMSTVATVMLNNGYDYLLVDDRDAQRKESLAANGFTLETRIGDYGIYTVHGIPALKKERNSMGQVVSVTTLDDSGSPVNGPDGYATVSYEYDGYANIVRQFRTDTQGKGVADGNGSAGWERVCNERGQVLLERTLDAEGNPVANSRGYAEVRREYRRTNLVREAYYDAEGRPVSRRDTGYAAVTFKSNLNGLVIEERYFDTEGLPMLSFKGYATVRREYNEAKKIIREEYYDEDGKPAVLAAGHVAIEQEYDSEGNLILRRYLNADGTPHLRKDGFSEVRWERQKDASIWNLVLFKPSGEEIPLDNVNLAKDIEGNGNWSGWMSPQYNASNSTFTIGSVNLGEKTTGDIYTCQIEIEFSGVTTTKEQDFCFWTQGAADGKWNIGNVWNPGLIKLDEAPKDGVYRFAMTSAVNKKMTETSTFDISFRCDNWASGSFRVRSVKIEKGDTAGPWSPGI